MKTKDDYKYTRVISSGGREVLVSEEFLGDKDGYTIANGAGIELRTINPEKVEVRKVKFVLIVQPGSTQENHIGLGFVKE